MLAKHGFNITEGRGFALVATLLCIALLAVLVMACVSLASIELRKSTLTEHERHARANARLALIQAIGQLQVAMGPDTRVSASSGLLSVTGQEHWTGVWSTRDPEDNAWIDRDDEGSLTDRRGKTGYDRREEVMQWLVSGASVPESLPLHAVEMVGPGSVDEPEKAGVRVPSVDIITNRKRGRIAWWTGDLSQRADLSKAASELIGNGVSITRNANFVSEASAAMVAGDMQWARKHFHDFTVHSQGLLTNAREGGLKKDLSVYFQSDGSVTGYGNSAGLSDHDRLAGPANPQEASSAGMTWEQNTLRETAPRFGLLRQWASLQSAIQNDEMNAVPPETVERNTHLPEITANLQPAKLSGAVRASIQPILLEASQAYAFSWFRKPGTGSNRHHLRKHIYPRIVLWNPYPVALKTRPMMVLLQINGRHDFWIDGYFPGINGGPQQAVRSPWISADGGRSRDFVPLGRSLFISPGFMDPHMGSYYYQLPATRFGPGERVVFSPADATDYRIGVRADGGDCNLASNLLVANQQLDPSHCLTVSDVRDQPGFAFIPTGITMESTAPWFRLMRMEPLLNHVDDVRVILKDAGDSQFIDVDGFDKLPQIAYLSGSLQYGAGKEPGIPWAGPRSIPIEETTHHPPRNPPDERSRDGLRLRTAGSSPSAMTEAALANWNPRAAYSLRSPRETFHFAEGYPGLVQAPWGFGIYERFMPVAQAQPNNGSRSYLLGNGDENEILFDLPRMDHKLVSIGQLQHARLSDLVWHPSRVVGNSLADPRVGLSGTLPAREDMCGYTSSHIGRSSDAERSPAPDSWAAAGRALAFDLPQQNGELIYDMVYETNHALWDRYFISGADKIGKAAFHADPLAHPLPNPHLTFFRTTGFNAEADLADFHRTACHLTIKGVFNINSVSVDAWAAMLARSHQGAATIFPRVAGEKTPEYSDTQIQHLAAAIVAEVKRRGPFLGMSDFVNRRLTEDETARCGALEAAIMAADMNASAIRQHPLTVPTPQRHPPEVAQPLNVNCDLKPKSTAWGTERFLTQADMLQSMGDLFSARSDTFVIRAYGESLDSSGKPQSRAWCEAVVQRMPTPVIPDSSGIEPADTPHAKRFGRRFELIRFRWLLPSEV